MHPGDPVHIAEIEDLDDVDLVHRIYCVADRNGRGWIRRIDDGSLVAALPDVSTPRRSASLGKVLCWTLIQKTGSMSSDFGILPTSARGLAWFSPTGYARGAALQMGGAWS